MRSTANEKSFIKAIGKKALVQKVLAFGMLARNDLHWIAWSPDGIDMIETENIGLTNYAGPQVSYIEIKTSISP